MAATKLRNSHHYLFLIIRQIICCPHLHISDFLLYMKSYKLTDKMPDIYHIRLFFFHGISLHLADLLRLFHVCFRYNVMRTMLCLHIGFGNVLPHNAEKERLHSADENNDADRGRPARYRIAEDGTPNDQKDQHKD